MRIMARPTKGQLIRLLAKHAQHHKWEEASDLNGIDGEGRIIMIWSLTGNTSATIPKTMSRFVNPFLFGEPGRVRPD